MEYGSVNGATWTILDNLHILILGGNNMSGKRVLELDGGYDKWTVRSSMTVGRSYPAILRLNALVYLFGGSDPKANMTKPLRSSSLL
jgi:hypothetical protein